LAMPAKEIEEILSNSSKNRKDELFVGENE
jgi:hypothetical protein